MSLPAGTAVLSGTPLLARRPQTTTRSAFESCLLRAPYNRVMEAEEGLTYRNAALRCALRRYIAFQLLLFIRRQVFSTPEQQKGRGCLPGRVAACCPPLPASFPRAFSCGVPDAPQRGFPQGSFKDELL